MFNLFRHLIRENAIEDRREQQGIVPDLKFSLPPDMGHDGLPRAQLGEVKTIQACASRYIVTDSNGSGFGKAVERRAGAIQREYQKKAHDLDTLHGGVPGGVDGPCFVQLMSFGIIAAFVFGAYGEASLDVERWIASTSNFAAAGMRGLLGAKTEKDARGTLAWVLRRRLAWSHLNAKSELLLDRLEFVGPGGQDAARRRRADSANRRARRELRFANLHRASESRRRHSHRNYAACRAPRRV